MNRPIHQRPCRWVSVIALIFLAAALDAQSSGPDVTLDDLDTVFGFRKPPTQATLQVVSVNHASGSTLQAGEDLVLRVHYTSPTSTAIIVSAQPYRKGRYASDAHYSVGRDKGDEGDVECEIGVRRSNQIDQVRLSMKTAHDGKCLTSLTYPIDIRWEGIVPGPDTVAPIGTRFPPLAFTGSQGETVDVQTLRGNVVLIDFWASWCGPCRFELPHLSAAYSKLHTNGFEIVGISLDTERKAFDEAIQKYGITWPQFFDGAGWKGELAKRFLVNRIPWSYLLDRQGVIRYFDLRGNDMVLHAEELLKETPSVEN